MFHYGFTNDLRVDKAVEDIHDFIEKRAKLWDLNKVPTAAEDKSLNNTSNSAGSYFNVKYDNNCRKSAVSGNTQGVLFNFIKKFQFPNPIVNSFSKTKEDGIKFAPLRTILKVLYVIYLIDGEKGYLSIDEIRDFIFFNEKIAKNEEHDYFELYMEIKKYREDRESSEYIEKYIAKNSEREWNNQDRQLGNMLTLMCESNCIIENKKKYRINNSIENNCDKSYIFEILMENRLWDGDTKEEYSAYMDMDSEVCMEMENVDSDDIIDLSDLNEISKLPRNRIIFGAPGTGKSYKLNSEKELFKNNYERVTFHPKYSYSQFVGTYKPCPVIDSDGNETITYKFVPGPFLRILVKSIKSEKVGKNNPYLLLIEEINRANMAAVFGDIFQLLDRENGVSIYKISTSEDMRKYLFDELGGKESDYEEIAIPQNMYIWATMNSADQGVFPMDTAFKRRWDFEYIGIDENKESMSKIIVKLGKDEHCVIWNDLREKINEILVIDCKVNEDKLLGPYFISKKIIEADNSNNVILDNDTFLKAFESKVIMYLYEDAARHKRDIIFRGCPNNSTYSEICKLFREKGEAIFQNDLNLSISLPTS